MSEIEARQVDRKARLRIPRQPFPKQDPTVRISNWKEAYLPVDLGLARIEAERCIQCPAAPCQKACPVGNDIPGALWKLEHGDAFGAGEIFHLTSELPEMCGRLCPQERLCEGDCVVGKKAAPVAIGRLEAYVADYYRDHGGYDHAERASPTGKRVAVVGAGPAGMVVAEQLAKRGHAVTVFDRWPEAGGVLRYGIPDFKMEKDVLEAKLAYLRQLGIEFVQGVEVGKGVTIDDLFERGYDAVFLGHGASIGNKLDVPGAELDGVLLATDFLVRANLSPAELPASMRQPLDVGEHLVVIGGGDTSMDCVRSAVRLGAKSVTCVYRRTEAEQAGRVEERIHAREEGVRFEYLASPLRLDTGRDGRVARAVFARMALGEPDASGRRRPVATGEEFAVEATMVVVAIGYRSDEDLAETGRIAHDGDRIVVEPDTGATDRPGVFAGGDCVNGADLVVTAVAAGRSAAEAIHQYLVDKAEEAA